MVIYADVLFLVNFISAYILLSLLGKFIIKSKIKIWRLCAAAAVGGIAAVIIFSREMPPAMSYLVRLLSAVIMVFTAFYEQKRQILNHIIWLVALSGMLIAAMVMLTMITRSAAGAVIKSGVVYFNLPYRIFLPMLALSYIAVTFFLKFMQIRRAKRLYTITITHSGKKITVTALFDSGNLLREPVTGKCVSLVEWNAAKQLFDEQCDYEELINHAGTMKLWAVPYHGVENRSGIIFAFLADSVVISEEHRVIEKTFIGLYSGRLSGNNEYNALLNSALL